MTLFHARCALDDPAALYLVRIEAPTLTNAAEALARAGADVRSISIAGPETWGDTWRRSAFKATCAVLLMLVMLSAFGVLVLRGRFAQLAGESAAGLVFLTALMLVGGALGAFGSARAIRWRHRMLRVEEEPFDPTEVRAAALSTSLRRSGWMRLVMVLALPGFVVMAAVSLVRMWSAGPEVIDAVFMLVVAGYMLASCAFSTHMPDPFASHSAPPDGAPNSAAA